MALKSSTGLKFSTGANDSLHPKLVKAGFTPESATAILEGKPLQGFGYPVSGFGCTAKGVAYPTLEQLRREGSLNPEAEREYMLLQIEKSIDGGRSFPQGWRPWRAVPDTALPETDPDVAALNVESQPESATGACGQTGETGYRFRDRARTLFDAGFEPIPIKKGTKRPPITTR